MSKGDASTRLGDPRTSVHPNIIPSEPEEDALRVAAGFLARLFAAEVAGCLEGLLQAPSSGAEPFLSVPEAAAYLACKQGRIYELKASGRLAHHKEGTRLLFRRADLDACVERIEARDA
jgi:excisionase family DNA binding protein